MLIKSGLDFIPLWMLFILSIGMVLVAEDGGFRLATFRKARMPEDIDVPIGSVVGSLLGLLAFLLSFTFGMAASRFDSRRQLLLSEVNAIGTAYLRSELVPEPQRSEIRSRLRDYVHLRATLSLHRETVEELVKRSEVLHHQLWQLAVSVENSERKTPVFALFISSLNDLIDRHEDRMVVSQYRIPTAIWFALCSVAILAMASVGYQFGNAGKRDRRISWILAPAFSMVFCLIADLDRAYEGGLQVSQRPMIQLDEQLHDQ